MIGLLSPSQGRLRIWLGLAFLSMLAGFLRFYGLGFGLPDQSARPDEELAVHVALDMAWSRDLNPHHFTYGGLFYYPLAALYLAFSKLAVWGGWLPGPEAFSALVRTAVTPFHLLARGYAAAAGTLTVLAVFLAGLGLRGRMVAWTAAGWTAVAYLAVRESHFGKPDALMVLLAVLAWAAAAQAWRSGRAADAALAGALAGLAAGAKLNAAPVMATVLLAVALSPGRRGTRALLALGAGALAFALVNPYMLLDSSAFARDMATLGQMVESNGNQETTPGWGRHLGMSLPWGLGWPLYLLGLAGFGLAALRRRPADLLLLSFPVLYFLLFAGHPAAFARYALPLVPFFALSAGLALEEALARWVRPSRQAVAAALAAVLVGLPTASDSWELDRLLARTDTRVEAMAWIQANVPSGALLLFQGGFGLPYPKPGGFPYRVHRLDDGQDLGEQALRNLDPECVVLRSYAYVPGSDPPPQLRRALASRYRLAACFLPDGEPGEAVFDTFDAFYVPFHGHRVVSRPGPSLWIWTRGVGEAPRPPNGPP